MKISLRLMVLNLSVAARQRLCAFFIFSLLGDFMSAQKKPMTIRRKRTTEKLVGEGSDPFGFASLEALEALVMAGAKKLFLGAEEAIAKVPAGSLSFGWPAVEKKAAGLSSKARNQFFFKKIGNEWGGAKGVCIRRQKAPAGVKRRMHMGQNRGRHANCLRSGSLINAL